MSEATGLPTEPQQLHPIPIYVKSLWVGVFSHATRIIFHQIFYFIFKNRDWEITPMRVASMMCFKCSQNLFLLYKLDPIISLYQLDSRIISLSQARYKRL